MTQLIKICLCLQAVHLETIKQILLWNNTKNSGFLKQKMQMENLWTPFTRRKLAFCSQPHNGSKKGKWKEHTCKASELVYCHHYYIKENILIYWHFGHVSETFTEKMTDLCESISTLHTNHLYLTIYYLFQGKKKQYRDNYKLSLWFIYSFLAEQSLSAKNNLPKNYYRCGDFQDKKVIHVIIRTVLWMFFSISC